MILTYQLTTLVTLAALVYTFILGGRVGLMRGKKGIEAPATSGDPEFERAFRIHYNTIENLVLVLPLMWLAAGAVGDLWSAVLGVLWLLGRIVYTTSYMSDPSKRGTGAMISAAAIGALAIIVLVSLVRGFLA